MNSGAEPEVEETVPHRKNISVPSITLKESQLKDLSLKDRVKFIGKELYASELSGFAKGAIAHKLLDYTLGGFARKSPTARLYTNALHRLVNFFEIESTLNAMVTLVGDNNEDSTQFDRNRIERTVERILHARWFSKFDISRIQCQIWSEENEGPACDVSVADVLHCLANLNKAVAEKHGCDLLYKEEFDEGDVKYHLYVFDMNNARYGFSSRVTGASGFYVRYHNCLYAVDSDWQKHTAMFKSLSAMAKENFINIVNPEKNILEMADKSMRIMPRQKAYARIPNLPVDEICKSISYAFETKTRRVIALVGDPGLGKTNAVHAILNSFPKTPAFLVTAAAMGFYREPANVRAIFNAVASIESLLVIDDFDGFDVGEKDATTNEFLLQLEGSRGFNGVAILIINDPAQVDRTIIDRPGRVDEVHMISYLTDPVDVIDAIKANFENVELAVDDSSVQFMIKHRFSTARIVGAAQYAFAHHQRIDNETVTDGANKLLLFQQNATCFVQDGRLVHAKTPKRELIVKPKRSRKFRG